MGTKQNKKHETERLIEGCHAQSEWRCANSQCINATRYCDRNVDCADGTDEMYCPIQGVSL